MRAEVLLSTSSLASFKTTLWGPLCPSAYSSLRRCSVRACTTPLADNYNMKMCEECRGKHRIYANTKRQKRKAEKMALVAQPGPVVWMPSGSPEIEEPPQNTHSHPHPQPQPHAHLHPSAPPSSVRPVRVTLRTLHVRYLYLM